MPGGAGCSLAWHMQEAFSRPPSHYGVEEGRGRVAHSVGPWIELRRAIESAGMPRGRQGKDTAVSWRPGFADSVQVVWRQAYLVLRYCFKVLWNFRGS